MPADFFSMSAQRPSRSERTRVCTATIRQPAKIFFTRFSVSVRLRGVAARRDVAFQLPAHDVAERENAFVGDAIDHKQLVPLASDEAVCVEHLQMLGEIGLAEPGL